MLSDRALGLGFPSGLLGLLRGRCCHLSDGTPERVLVAVSAKLARGVDELLALASAVVGHRFGLSHVNSLADLSAPCEVRRLRTCGVTVPVGKC